MNREIKFRAWLSETHSGKNQMFYQGEQYLQSFLRRCCHLSNKDGREHEKYGNYELMQYTGRKDKNDKDIYESDIVRKMLSPGMKIKHKNGEWLNYEDLVVEFKDYKWSFVMTIDYDGTEWCYDFDQLEVIGNIYENPELLPTPNQEFH